MVEGRKGGRVEEMWMCGAAADATMVAYDVHDTTSTLAYQTTVPSCETRGFPPPSLLDSTHLFR